MSRAKTLAELKNGDIIRSGSEVYVVENLVKNDKWVRANIRCVYCSWEHLRTPDSPGPPRVGRVGTLGGPVTAKHKWAVLPNDPAAWAAAVEKADKRHRARYGA